MKPPRKRRKRHAASRARKLTAVLTVFTFVGIGQAINLAARTATSAQTVAQTASSTSLPSASKRSASVSTASITTTAVTGTHAS
jgi:hypothetical protein